MIVFFKFSSSAWTSTTMQQRNDNNRNVIPWPVNINKEFIARRRWFIWNSLVLSLAICLHYCQELAMVVCFVPQQYVNFLGEMHTEWDSRLSHTTANAGRFTKRIIILAIGKQAEYRRGIKILRHLKWNDEWFEMQCASWIGECCEKTECFYY